VNITVLGATGRTGRPLVEELLTRGHNVTALVRDPTTYAAPDGVTVVAGHSRETAVLAAAVAGWAAWRSSTPSQRGRICGTGMSR
jgi:uncharacterized protein YbjT (DUF2867 family)